MGKMCGIFSYYSSTSRLSEEAITRVIQSMRYRGPDGHEVWRDETSNMLLVHTRLSINDATANIYPLSNEDGSLQLIINGEIYGYRNLRTRLESRGHHFKTETDGEVIVHLYEEKGIRCLEDLRGEFAFILWDRRTQTLFAARDRFGIKPLHCYSSGNGVFIASEIPSLFAAGVRAKWDQANLWSYLHCHLSPTTTLFEGIQQVPAGGYLLMTENKLNIGKYWDLDLPKRDEYGQHSEEEHIANIRQLLIDSVGERLQAGVPVGVYLSGGIDSAALLGIAAAIDGKKMDAFTIQFEDERFDESSYAQVSANFNNANLHTLKVNEHDIACNFENAVNHACVPISNGAGVARYLLSRFAQADSSSASIRMKL